MTAFIYENFKSAGARQAVVFRPNMYGLICRVIENVMHTVRFELADEQIPTIRIMTAVPFQNSVTPSCVNHEIVTARDALGHYAVRCCIRWFGAEAKRNRENCNDKNCNS